MMMLLGKWFGLIHLTGLCLCPASILGNLQPGHTSFIQNRPPMPASERMLLCFCTHLARRLHHSSIKVFLSAVRSLHIAHSSSVPLSNN